ncbi:MAG: hypothetical protein V3S76_03285, partial [Candidatus Bipolaricaulota bacterium]
QPAEHQKLPICVLACWFFSAFLLKDINIGRGGAISCSHGSVFVEDASRNNPLAIGYANGQKLVSHLKFT